MSELTISPLRIGSRLVLRVGGRLGYEQARIWRRELDRCWRGSAGSITVDLSDISYLDSAGAALLITASHRARREARGFHLTGLRTQARHVFRLIGFLPCLPPHAGLGGSSNQSTDPPGPTLQLELLARTPAKV